MNRFNMNLGSDIVRAQQLFDKCIDLLAGLGQPPHSPDEKTAEINREKQAEGELELIRIAAELFEGFTGIPIQIDIPDVDDAHGGVA